MSEHEHAPVELHANEEDLEFLIENFRYAVKEGNLEEAEEWYAGIMHRLAWNRAPRTVALIDDELNRLRNKLAEDSVIETDS